MIEKLLSRSIGFETPRKLAIKYKLQYKVGLHYEIRQTTRMASSFLIKHQQDDRKCEKIDYLNPKKGLKFGPLL